MNTIEHRKTTYIREADIVVEKKCDVCGKNIPQSAFGYGNEHPFFLITTHHNDWGNDSGESYQYYDACCPQCAVEFAQKYLSDCFEGINSCVMEIEHKRGWGYGKDELA